MYTYVLSEQEKSKIQVEQLKSENELFRSLLAKLTDREGSVADNINQTLAFVLAFPYMLSLSVQVLFLIGQKTVQKKYR